MIKYQYTGNDPEGSSVFIDGFGMIPVAHVTDSMAEIAIKAGSIFFEEVGGDKLPASLSTENLSQTTVANEQEGTSTPGAGEDEQSSGADGNSPEPKAESKQPENRDSEEIAIPTISGTDTGGVPDTTVGDIGTGGLDNRTDESGAGTGADIAGSDESGTGTGTDIAGSDESGAETGGEEPEASSGTSRRKK